MNTSSLCLFVIVCVYVGQIDIAAATIGFQQHVGKRDLEEIAGFTAVRGKKNLVLSLPVAVATIGFQQRVGKRDLEEIAGFTAVRGKKNLVLSLPVAVATIDFQQHVGKRDIENMAGFSAVRGKKNHDLSLPPDVLGSNEFSQDKIYNIPIIYYTNYNRDQLARLLDTLTAIENEASNSETADEYALPVEIKSLRSKKEKIQRIASNPGFEPTKGKKSFEEYYDEY